MEILISLLSAFGASGVVLFFVKRYFGRRDAAEMEEREQRKAYFKKIDISLDTLKLLAYERMSEETEKFLTKGYATPAERRVLDELFKNYKAHGWNGDMDARLEKVYALRTAPREKEE